jgi:hypothetical protein
MVYMMKLVHSVLHAMSRIFQALLYLERSMEVKYRIHPINPFHDKFNLKTKHDFLFLHLYGK